MAESSLHPVQTHFPRPTSYVAVASIDEALAILASAEPGTARAIAGGSDLLLEIERGVRKGISTVIDLSRIADANQIRIDSRPGGPSGDVAMLGPLVTHNHVVGSVELRQRALPLPQACFEVASPQLRNRATISGNVITASPANDTISALLALNATVSMRSLQRGPRSVPLSEFITGFRTTLLAADELVTGIEVPMLAQNERGMFVKLGNRKAQAISVVHLAIVVGFESDMTTVASARMAVGSVAATVVVLSEALRVLIGSPLSEGAILKAANCAKLAITPISDIRATADYRLETVSVMVARALRALRAGTQADSWPLSVPHLRNGDAVQRTGFATHRVEAGSSIDVTVNGEIVSGAEAVGETLLDWLRETADLKGTKEGCAEGECGACTVWLDGVAVMSCLVPAARAHGCAITTVEGLGSASGALQHLNPMQPKQAVEPVQAVQPLQPPLNSLPPVQSQSLHPLQEAFVACGAVQCGYCTPGFLMAGAMLLKECPQPTNDEIEIGLSGNLCRCTGYKSIVSAFHLAMQTVGEPEKEVAPS